jgi:hypothetical protein
MALHRPRPSPAGLETVSASPALEPASIRRPVDAITIERAFA